MDFREFATNYLNPIFLMYRAIILMSAFFILFFSLPMFIKSASGMDTIIILIISIALSVGLYSLFRHRAYILYLVIPILLLGVALGIRGNDVVENGVLMIPMAMWWTSAFLLAFNGLRSWGYGISLNEINNKLDNKN